MQTLELNTLVHDRYLLVGLVSRGGMGAVYQATDQRLGTPVAVKHRLVSGDRLAEAFEHEARLLAELHHPALPRVIDHFRERSDQFLVMDFIPGEDLGQVLARGGRPFPVSQVLPWARQLLRVLQFLHRRHPPVVHRDIKPSNLKLDPEGNVILLDFGLAKGGSETAGGDSFPSLPGCTPGYAPLEQLQSAGTGPHSDIYSLAATLYHLGTGCPPPNALTRAAALLDRRPDPYRPPQELNPSLPRRFGSLLSRMIALSVTDRPGDAGALLAELDGIAPGVQGGPPEPAPPRQPPAPGPDAPTTPWGPTPHDRPPPPASPALCRARMITPVLRGARVLWVDDNPDDVSYLCGILAALGMSVDLVSSSEEGLARSRAGRYDVIVSDIARGGIPDEGLHFLGALGQGRAHPRVIFFIANFDPGRGVPRGSFGITNSGEELLHLIFDVLERDRS